MWAWYIIMWPIGAAIGIGVAIHERIKNRRLDK